MWNLGARATVVHRVGMFFQEASHLSLALRESTNFYHRHFYDSKAGLLGEVRLCWVLFSVRLKNFEVGRAQNK